MIVVSLIAAFIAGATVWFLARAVRRVPAPPAAEDRDAMTQLRDRLLAQLHELDVEEGDRNVDSNVAADERWRLEAELAQVLRSLESSAASSAEPAAAGTSPQLWWPTIFVLSLMLPLVSASLYFLKNGSTLAQLSQARSGGDTSGPLASAATGQTVPPMVYQMVARLEKRLKEQPNDPEGWARLARSYDVLGRKEDAHQAYVRAYKLAPDNTEVVAAYAGFLMSLNPSRMTAETIAVFRKLHTLDPRHPGALWALGFAAYQQRRYAQAVSYWEQLLALLPPDNEAVPQLKHALSIARTEAAKAKK